MSKVTENLSAYIKNNKVNLSVLSRKSGVPYRSIYNSVANQGRKRELRDWELLEVCRTLNVDPMKLLPEEAK